MFLAKIVFVVFTCASLINYVFAEGGEDEEETATEELEEKRIEEEETPPPPQDNHTFVALIDIVFTDGSKRTCTGTIIHDNVVITAAHCFSDHNAYAQAELTASFVVIGTKRMFETGYENYLPIERVITHPKFKGWTADVALVYTFAGMTSDKPGNVIPLVGENTLTPVDSNVTILSWGHCKDEIPQTHTRGPVIVSSTDRRLCDSSEDNSCEPMTTPYVAREGYNSERMSSVNQESDETAEQITNWQRDRMQPDEEMPYVSKQQTEKFPYEYGRQGRSSSATTRIQSRIATLHVSYDKRPAKVQKFANYMSSREDFVTKVPRSSTTRISNRYLASSEVKEKNRGKKREKVRVPPPSKHRYHKSQRNTNNSEDQSIMVMMDADQLKLKLFVDPTRRDFQRDQTRRKEKLMVEQGRERKYFVGDDGTKVLGVKDQTKPRRNKIQSYYKNWRRQLGTKENHLTVETFGFVNVQTCKKLVDKALPAVYSINPNHVVCYASEDHYINDEDSGAPAIRQGQLVAVTLGGVECEGDHVAIGIKMSCLCSWIADNLPDGEKDIKCCKNCCNDNNGDNKVNNIKRNKYLYQ